MIENFGFELFAERAFFRFKHNQLPLKIQGLAVQPGRLDLRGIF